jgi:cytochrome oxidase Cu insertion factor (SCO1/SenC/PrrC family)
LEGSFNTFSLERGVLICVGYTCCPEAYPFLLSGYSEAISRLGPDPERVMFIP